MRPIAEWMKCVYDSPVPVSSVEFDQGDELSGRMDFDMGTWGVEPQRACPTI